MGPLYQIAGYIQNVNKIVIEYSWICNRYSVGIGELQLSTWYCDTWGSMGDFLISDERPSKITSIDVLGPVYLAVVINCIISPCLPVFPSLFSGQYNIRLCPDGPGWPNVGSLVAKWLKLVFPTIIQIVDHSIHFMRGVQTQTQTKFIQQKYLQVPYQVYMSFVKNTNNTIVLIYE